MPQNNPSSVGWRDWPLLVSVREDVARRRHLMRHPDLTYLFWESTLRCNLRCDHCGSRCEASSTITELTTDQVCRIVDSIAHDFDARRIFVSITGGEPLVRADVYEVAHHMAKVGMRCCVVTNGTLIGPSEACRLTDTGMRTVSISVDGLEPDHDAVRGPGTFCKALGAITACRQAGFEIVEAITCVRPANLDSLDAIEAAVRDAGATHWRLITIDRMGRLQGRPRPDMWLLPHQICRLLDHIASRRKQLAAQEDPFRVQFSCGGFLGVRRELAVRPGDGQCFAGLCVASILCDGMVGACPSLPRSWAQGSALDTRFSTLWHERFVAYRDMSWRRSGVCAKCSWFDVCQGGGLHERLAQPDEFCWLQRQTIHGR